MEPCPGSGIHFGIAVMNHVHLPHPLDPVQQKMGQILGHQVQDQKGYDKLDPKWPIGQIKQSSVVNCHLMHDDQCEQPKNQVDQDDSKQ